MNPSWFTIEHLQRWFHCFGESRVCTVELLPIFQPIPGEITKLSSCARISLELDHSKGVRLGGRFVIVRDELTEDRPEHNLWRLMTFTFEPQKTTSADDLLAAFKAQQAGTPKTFPLTPQPSYLNWIKNHHFVLWWKTFESNPVTPKNLLMLFDEPDGLLRQSVMEEELRRIAGRSQFACWLVQSVTPFAPFDPNTYATTAWFLSARSIFYERLNG